ncbi:hypothetical protein IG631_20651 [Alternaria alternata]|nr:hypothetical protein IG631_20651 [Alternaria alternata]
MPTKSRETEVRHYSAPVPRRHRYAVEYFRTFSLPAMEAVNEKNEILLDG